MGPPPVSSDTRVQADILELLVRARNYRGKPHQLYSHIAAMGRNRSSAGRRGRTG